MGVAAKSTTVAKKAAKESMKRVKSFGSGLKSCFITALVVIASVTTPSCLQPKVACESEPATIITEATEVVSKRDESTGEACADNCAEVKGVTDSAVKHIAATNEGPTKLGHLCTTQTISAEPPPPALLMSQSSVLSTFYFDALDNLECSETSACFFDASDNLDCAEASELEGICSTLGTPADLPNIAARLSSDTAQAVDTEAVPTPPIVGDGEWSDNKLLIRSIYLAAVRKATGSDTPSKSMFGLDSPCPMGRPSLSSTMVAA